MRFFETGFDPPPPYLDPPGGPTVPTYGITINGKDLSSHDIKIVFLFQNEFPIL